MNICVYVYVYVYNQPIITVCGIYVGIYTCAYNIIMCFTVYLLHFFPSCEFDFTSNLLTRTTLLIDEWWWRKVFSVCFFLLSLSLLLCWYASEYCIGKWNYDTKLSDASKLAAIIFVRLSIRFRCKHAMVNWMERWQRTLAEIVSQRNGNWLRRLNCEQNLMAKLTYFDWCNHKSHTVHAA